MDPEDPGTLLQLGNFFQFHGDDGAAIVQYNGPWRGTPASPRRCCAWAPSTRRRGAGPGGPLVPVGPGPGSHLGGSQFQPRRHPGKRGQAGRGAGLPAAPARPPAPGGGGGAPAPADRAGPLRRRERDAAHRELLLPKDTTTRIKWFPECATDEQEASLPPFDLVFNAIGNADLGGSAWERLRRFHGRRPMLNPPDRVLATRRDLMPGLLAGLPGVVVPKVARLGREEVPGTRSPGAAGGRKVWRCPSWSAPSAPRAGRGPAGRDRGPVRARPPPRTPTRFYAIAFHDTRVRPTATTASTG